MAEIEWNPMRAMREMLRWDPFRETASLRGWEPLRERALPAEWNPRFDVTETDDAYVFEADVPGIQEEDLEISATGNRIDISGERDLDHEAADKTFHACERQTGMFARSFTLPDDADLEHAASTLEHGVLTLVVPKTTVTSTKQIPISIK